MKIIRAEKLTPEIVKTASLILRNGGVIAYPTDTIYGLGALATDDKAVHKIYEIKQRSLDKPMLMLAGSLEQIRRYAHIPEKHAGFIDEKWPGPVSLVLPAKTSDLASPLSRQGTVAIRLPADKMIQDLALRAGAPIVSTSLNKSGWSPVASPAEVFSHLPEAIIDLAIDVGPLYGHPSGLFDLTGEEIKVIRK